MDFILSTYESLINSLKNRNYHFVTVEEYFSLGVGRLQDYPLVMMRHDVDRNPNRSLRMAKLEYKLGVRATYYFRTISQTFNPKIIKEIADLGHEIGYHYENLSMAERLLKRSKPEKVAFSELEAELNKLAIEDFKNNLARLRRLYPVKTICKHGAPLSKYDNGDIWKAYDYKEEGIIGEPNFDIDWNDVLYISDAARAWNNKNISRRDWVKSNYNYVFNDTKDIIKVLNEGKLPRVIMINIHPEHWAGDAFEWLEICMLRKIKNTVKKIYLRSQ